MEGSKKISLDIEGGIQGFPELGCEGGSTISNGADWYAVKLTDVSYVHRGNFIGSGCVV